LLRNAAKLIELNEKIKVGAVSYLNTKPLLYGIEHAAVFAQMDLHLDYPAKIAEALLNGEIDLGLVPVAILQRMPFAEIVTEVCIGCDGAVASVCLFSDVPIAEVKTVLLDYQSRTSVRLLRILLQEYWQVQVEIQDTKDDYTHLIEGTTAGLVIGDRAFAQRMKSKFAYDLGEVWKQHTGLPFVFAAWVANKKLPADFLQAFAQANLQGLQHIENVLRNNVYDQFDLRAYYTKNISYHLDDAKQKGMQLFLQKLNAYQL
jgi:chorismate dehydratase